MLAHWEDESLILCPMDKKERKALNTVLEAMGVYVSNNMRDAREHSNNNASEFRSTQEMRD